MSEGVSVSQHVAQEMFGGPDNTKHGIDACPLCESLSTVSGLFVYFHDTEIVAAMLRTYCYACGKRAQVPTTLPSVSNPVS